ncbi:AfsR/SARP family transcriptional regulator [Micromonospora sp. NBC_01796]|uniref:AfsR/SARP family transcriptional regulator n=1 Tax=Micromonospora sp. NBC_01796 TaxID=2975987 RepID=UPI002DD9F504|nr:BTAD domain-containing putative transcriptional regulator [Micromonospora sp. NBC_01796]WSA86439.1 tetratricopeptide repeat protein [Micromonospora sp. NBC_01796]
MTEEKTDPVRLTVLGPVRLWRDGTEVQLGAPQVRALLAVLLAQVGTPVSLAEIVDVLWGQDPPATATNAVHGHVGALRRLLEPSLGAREHGRWLSRSAGGYQLAGDAESVDLLDFRRLLGQARAAVAAGRDGAAVAHFVAALRLPQGPCAANVSATVRSHPIFGGLERECLAGVREAADCALRAGRAAELVAGIQRIAERFPLDEPLQARLILLLAASGQQAQALALFGRVRTALVDDLGIDPGAELRAAYEAVLRQQHGTGTAAVGDRRPDTTRPDAAGPTGSPHPVRPAQLPPDLSTFVGRRGELARALSLIPEEGAEPGTVVISAISGMAGAGKTTLAVRWAHRVIGRYPDGQLYLNLHGFGPSDAVVSPDDALREIFETLGVAPDRIPESLDGRTALYRSLLAGRKMLVVLDNARDADQVRPLLPASPGCLAIVTSRNQLAGLVAVDGAYPLVLDTLPVRDAHKLLSLRIGGDRLDNEPEATAAILRRCGGLPLALAIVAARAATYPALSLASINAELDDEEGPLDVFADADSAVDPRAVFSWSYHALSPGAARLFRLLGGVRNGHDIGQPAAASLAGVPVREVRPLLTELTRASLVLQGDGSRYTMHDLLGAYADELARQHDSEAERREAWHRLLDHYLHTAHAAERLFSPLRPTVPLGPAPSTITVAPMCSADEALSWFVAERHTLVASIARAAADGLAGHAWQLARALEPFLFLRGHWEGWLPTMVSVLAATERDDDRTGQAYLTRVVGSILVRYGRYDEASVHLARSLRLFGDLGDRVGQAVGHRCLNDIRDRQNRTEEALEHARQALALYASVDDRNGQALALNAIGWTHARIGEYEPAVEHCNRALVIFEEVGNPRGLAATWDSLGFVHHCLAEYAQATQCYDEAIRIRGEIGDLTYEAASLDRLGDTLLAGGELDAALSTWHRALVIMAEVGHPRIDQVLAKLAGH